MFLDHIAFCVISYQTPGGQIFCHGKRKINLMLNKTKIIVFTLWSRTHWNPLVPHPRPLFSRRNLLPSCWKPSLRWLMATAKNHFFVSWEIASFRWRRSWKAESPRWQEAKRSLHCPWLWRSLISQITFSDYHFDNDYHWDLLGQFPLPPLVTPLSWGATTTCPDRRDTEPRHGLDLEWGTIAEIAWAKIEIEI